MVSSSIDHIGWLERRTNRVPPGSATEALRDNKRRVDIGFSNAAVVRKTLWSYGNAKSPRPGARAKEQCLGDMPWKHRATAIKPGAHYLVQSVVPVKSSDYVT
jgi:hypothetical protein